MHRVKYKNPPIEEAICQFTFAHPLPWGPDTPRQLFEKLRERYPAMPQQQQILQANLTSGASPESPGLSLAPTERVVFADAENLSRFSVGPQTMAVHRARPYIGFEEDMLPRIRESVPSSIEFLQRDPLFTNVSVRYINRIQISDTEFDLTEYFEYWNSANLLPSSFDGTVTGFFYRTAAKQTSSPLNLTLNFGSVEAPKDTAAFVLDIDLVYNFDDPVPSNEAIERVIKVKAVENSIFESLISDRTRELFK
jgi:uncharacterized protein (TIGR04255 family)